MQKVRVPITNFQFGEVSPSLSSRTDSDIYNASAKRIQNLFLRAEGGVVKRNGLLNHHKFTEAVATASTGFIYVADYATISVGSVIHISDVDGTLYVLQAEQVGLHLCLVPLDASFLPQGLVPFLSSSQD